MNNIKSLWKDYKDTEKLANINLDNTDYRTRPGREMLKNDSIRKLETLRGQLETEMKASAFTVFPIGENSGKFAELAKVEGALVVDGSTIYKKIAANIVGTMSNSNTFGVHQYQVLISDLKQIAVLLNTKVALPEYTDTLQLKDKSEVQGLVKNMVESLNGTTLQRMFIEKEAFQEGVKEEVDGKVVPVVVLNLTEQEQSSLIGTLFRGKGLTVNLKDEVTTDTVTQTFKLIAKQLKG